MVNTWNTQLEAFQPGLPGHIATLRQTLLGMGHALEVELDTDSMAAVCQWLVEAPGTDQGLKCSRVLDAIRLRCSTQHRSSYRTSWEDQLRGFSKTQPQHVKALTELLQSLGYLLAAPLPQDCLACVCQALVEADATEEALKDSGLLQSIKNRSKLPRGPSFRDEGSLIEAGAYLQQPLPPALLMYQESASTGSHQMNPAYRWVPRQAEHWVLFDPDSRSDLRQMLTMLSNLQSNIETELQELGAPLPPIRLILRKDAQEPLGSETSVSSAVLQIVTNSQAILRGCSQVPCAPNATVWQQHPPAWVTQHGIARRRMLAARLAARAPTAAQPTPTTPAQQSSAAGTAAGSTSTAAGSMNTPAGTAEDGTSTAAGSMSTPAGTAEDGTSTAAGAAECSTSTATAAAGGSSNTAGAGSGSTTPSTVRSSKRIQANKDKAKQADAAAGQQAPPEPTKGSSHQPKVDMSFMTKPAGRLQAAAPVALAAEASWTSDAAGAMSPVYARGFPVRSVTEAGHTGSALGYHPLQSRPRSSSLSGLLSAVDLGRPLSTPQSTPLLIPGPSGVGQASHGHAGSKRVSDGMLEGSGAEKRLRVPHSADPGSEHVKMPHSAATDHTADANSRYGVMRCVIEVKQVKVLAKPKRGVVITDQEVPITAFDPINLVDAFNDKHHPDHAVAKAVVTQITTDMILWDLQYGIITCYWFSWIVHITAGTRDVIHIYPCTHANTAGAAGITAHTLYLFASLYSLKTADKKVADPPPPSGADNVDASAGHDDIRDDGSYADSKKQKDGDPDWSMKTKGNGKQQQGGHKAGSNTKQRPVYGTLEVLSIIAEGCHGLILSALWDGVEVIAKLLGPDSEGIGSYNRELQVYHQLQQLQGVQVPMLVAAGETLAGVHFIATKPVQGQPLQAFLATALPGALRKAYEAAEEALMCIRAVLPGFIHGDLRGPNILLASSGKDTTVSAVFLDFGASRTDGSPQELQQELKQLKRLFLQ